MTTPADIQTLLFTEAIRLVSPGGDFELGEEEVLGSTMQVFVNRGRRLHEVVADSVKWGDREYVVSDDQRLTFAEHAAQVSSFARALQEEHGVGPGDRVAIASANSAAWITAFWATVSIGAVAVGFNAWWTRREMDHALDLTTPTLVLADPKREKVLEGISAPVASLTAAVSDAAARYPDAPLPSCEGSEDDPAVILFTSGTSGRAKGAAHSHRNLMSVIEYHRFNDAMTKVMGGPQPEDRRYLLALPLFHVAGLHNLAVPRLATGSKVVLYNGAFDADRVLRLIERERVTNWGAVPTMANRLLELGDLSRYDTSSLTSFALASAPSSPAFKERLRQNVPFAANALVDSYGLTETSTGVSVASPMDLAESPGTLGRPIMTVQVEIRDEDGNALPDGEEGEICVRSPFNMFCYWNDEAATAATLREDRWLHTGDIGVLEGGRLRLSTRRSDLILRGGENVYPVEVEGVLTEHPDVEECVVMGVEHPDLGEEVGAVVVLRDGATTTEDELRTWAAEQLAYFKVPSRWRFRTEPLPRTATQKVVRREVADLA